MAEQADLDTLSDTELEEPAQEQICERVAAPCRKRLTFLLVVTVVWNLAGPIGLGLCCWWFHATDKAMPV